VAVPNPQPPLVFAPNPRSYRYTDGSARQHARAQRAVRPTLVPRHPQDPRELSLRRRSQILGVTMEDPMSEGNSEVVSVRVIPNTSGNPPGKLADAEVIFEADAGPLSGLKLIGFAIWERRTGGRNVTFPARQYSVNGERRTFALLRPANGDVSAQTAIRDLILDALSRIEAKE